MLHASKQPQDSYLSMLQDLLLQSRKLLELTEQSQWESFIEHSIIYLQAFEKAVEYQQELNTNILVLNNYDNLVKQIISQDNKIRHQLGLRKLELQSLMRQERKIKQASHAYNEFNE